MTPSTGKQYDPLEELDALDTPRPAPKAADTKKTTEKPAEKKPSNNSSWLTSIFSKIVPKPPNQAHLSDDKNPKVRICIMFSSNPFKNYDGWFYVLCR